MHDLNLMSNERLLGARFSCGIYRIVMKIASLTLLLLTMTIGSFEAGAQSRDQIRIVGSSTVFPFSTSVAEEFGRNSKFKTPVVEATGSGGGLKLFCGGIGTNHPDITTASRRIKQTEIDLCRENGVSELIEIKLGYDGIVLTAAKNAVSMNLSLRELYLALAAQVPDPNSSNGGLELIDNPYQTWNQINPDLPDNRILVYGPPPTSGTRDAFNELAIEAGCDTFQELELLHNIDQIQHRSVCRSIREDGAFIETGENDNLIVQKLQSDDKAIGIFGFSFLDQNNDIIKAFSVSHDDEKPETPSYNAIAGGEYPISRSLYVYVKKAHINVVPGIKEFLLEFASENAWGEFGYLTDKGLIPLNDEERILYERVARELVVMDLNSGSYGDAPSVH